MESQQWHLGILSFITTSPVTSPLHLGLQQLAGTPTIKQMSSEYCKQMNSLLALRELVAQVVGY